MKKEMPKWKEKSSFERRSSVFSLILAISCLILSILALVGSWEGAIFVSEPLIGLLMLNLTVQFWKYNKAVAIFTLIAALVSFGVAICLFFFK